MMWTEGGQPDHLTFSAPRGGGKGGGSSSGSSFSQSTSSTQLPDWLNNASQQAVTTAQNLSQQPYNPYTGQMVADVPADTQAAYQAVRNMQGVYDPAYTQAQGIYGNLAAGAVPQTADQLQALTDQLYGGYQSGVISPVQGLLSPYLGQGPATAGQVAGNALTIMSPFSSAVLDPAIKMGQQQLAQNLQTIGAGANQAGAFGGTRQGVMEGVAQSQAANQLAQTYGNLLNQGWQEALTPATQVALQGGAQGLAATNALAGLYSGGYGAAQQAGQGMMNQNLAAGLQGAQGLTSTAAAQQAADQKNASLMQTIGSAQQNQQQAELNAQLSQFYEQQQWPYQQLDTLLGAVGAVPYGTTTSATSYGTQQQNMQRNLAGSILGGAAQGAGMGAMFGPIGMGVGGAIGGLLGGL